MAALTVPCPLLERPPGYDRVRNAEIGNKDFELDVLEEAYTTEHWLVRIYKVRPRNEPKLPKFGKKTMKYHPTEPFLPTQVKDLDNRGLSRT